MKGKRKGSKTGLVARGIAIVCVVFVLLVAFLLSGLFFLFQGETDRSSMVIAMVESSIEEGLGKEFDVVIENMNLDFANIGNIGITSKNAVLKQTKDNAVVANIGEVGVELGLFSLFSDQPRVKSIHIKNAAFRPDSELLQSKPGMPPHLDNTLKGYGDFLAAANRTLEQNEFEEIVIEDSSILLVEQSKDNDKELKIKKVALVRNEDGLNLSFDMITDKSNISLESTYISDPENIKKYTFDIKGINLQEWFENPVSDEGTFSMDSIIQVSGELTFDKDNKPLDPMMKATLLPGKIRIDDDTTDLDRAELNFKVFLDRNQIELEKSYIEAGRFRGTLLGGLKPVKEQNGYGGPVRYDFLIKPGFYQPQDTKEEVIPGAFQVTGDFDVEQKNLRVENIVLTTHRGAIKGKGEIDFTGETPAVKGNLATDGISVNALKQFWPFFVADGARKWIQENVKEGWVESGVAHVDIPPGILFRLKQGKQLTKDQYHVEFNVKQLVFTPLGDIPPITDASGKVTLAGQSVETNLTSGKVSDGSGKSVKISTGRFFMPNFAAKPKKGEVGLELNGDLGAIARISDSKPLRVMQRMKTSANQFSGKGHANIAVKFPIKKDIKYNDVNWNVLLEVNNGKSSKPLVGHEISGADLLIDANPRGANVTGTALIDDVNTRLQLTEPIGKSGKVKLKRIIKATLDDEQRKKLGYDLSPVIQGVINIKINQLPNAEIHEIDFSKAEINLPWIGWKKGTGIPATGQYTLKKQGKQFVLNDFKLQGTNFLGEGTLVLDTAGLISADFNKLKLNEGDDLRLKIKRDGENYNINANGLTYDTRSIINSLIHAGSFKEAQGGRSVNLVANIETIKGFNDRVMRNAILLYESRKGKLYKLDMSATGSDGRKYAAQAQLNGNDTLFSMQSNDAGNALAFTDIYSKMRGGRLEARLLQSQQGPFLGPVVVKNFEVVNEPRLKKMASNVRSHIPRERGGANRILPDAEDKIIRFKHAEAKIKKGDGYLEIEDAVIRSSTMGLTMSGTLYDNNNNMNISGTFMPANAVNLVVSAIPILGDLLSNGRDSALIGITYRLKGKHRNPQMVVNPLSIVTPGVFNKVFEFKQ